MNPFHRLHLLRRANDAHIAYMAEHQDRFETMRHRHDNGTAPRAIVADNLFQTPPHLAERLIALADIHIPHTVLEPSVGLGRLIHALYAQHPEKPHVTTCDVSPACLQEIYTTFPAVTIKQGDFLEKHLGTFDRIIMNPPFRMRSDIRHIKHALTHLAEGGKLTGICMAGRFRERDIMPLCTHWEALPQNTFQQEGTNVQTILFQITT